VADGNDSQMQAGHGRQRPSFGWRGA